jgi:hypothetical protein
MPPQPVTKRTGGSRSLALPVGHDPAQMRHWFYTANHHTGKPLAGTVQRLVQQQFINSLAPW